MILYGEGRWHEVTRVRLLRPAKQLPPAVEIPQTEDWILLHALHTHTRMNRFIGMRSQGLPQATDAGGAFRSVTGGRSR
jgi:hypothetical protein